VSTTTPLLSVRGITKRFGGVVANRDVSFDVGAGELIGLIGPNGAGKSTLFEIITGFYAPDAGEVRLDGQRLTGLGPDRISRLGVGRTFQKLRPFPGMTVTENVMVGALQKCHEVRRARQEALEVLGPRRPTPTPARSPPASASGSSSRARWPRSRGCCSWTR
jgi:branched-chain amino acid transport system ATP-binding protein